MFFCGLTFYRGTRAQTNETSDYRARQLETIAEKNEAEPEDDSYELDLDDFSRHPLNLNKAAEEELIQLHMLISFADKKFSFIQKIAGTLIKHS